MLALEEQQVINAVAKEEALQAISLTADGTGNPTEEPGSSFPGDNIKRRLAILKQSDCSLWLRETQHQTPLELKEPDQAQSH